ncbi:hypothetical protein XAC3810_290062 [Xanthomonas citri pv. citri]|uniref:Uncharacterized protein n=1 Tax=Xanthomonas citri pv. citri TaxID=611301 RepID=A0A0U5FGU6_XANCI|nr:hypothetical protein XAC9322_320015 [Xanthomonas citri pv. citri]CEE23942.1 hypothetical protein XAC3824_360014 [Xanthomonas citri pv. citri]CEE25549.1 hypothetical protein XAC1083_310014 [Xanthomonas citri pv. citri]CEE33904.1 hypothetical protein XAC3810_290062 [Xanthomonas citri pv. citri]CEE36567.1 hypothetical protein XAC902_430013 [Xanthomonas citri pv. citri]
MKHGAAFESVGKSLRGCQHADGLHHFGAAACKQLRRLRRALPSGTDADECAIMRDIGGLFRIDRLDTGRRRVNRSTSRTGKRTLALTRSQQPHTVSPARRRRAA